MRILPLLAVAFLLPAGTHAASGVARAGASITEYGADPTGVKGSSAAINAALAERRVVHAPCGTYRLEAPVRLPSGGTLRGAGRCTVFVVPEMGFSGERVITNDSFELGNQRITISDFSVRVKGKPGKGRNPGVIRFQRVDGLTIERIYTDRYASEYDVIHLAGGIQNATVRGCVLRNAQPARAGGALGVYGGPTPGAAYATAHIEVTGNTLESTYDEAIAVYGWFTSVSDVRVNGNTLVNRGPTELAVGILGSNLGQPGVVQDVVFSDNMIVGKTHILTGASRVSFVRNTITGPVAAGEDAVFLAAARGPVPNDIVLAGNTIRGAARYGVYSEARDLTLKDNTIERTRSYGIHGGTNISGNIVRRAGSVGILSYGTASAVRGNTVVGSSTGIVFHGGAEHVAISKNTIVDATADGIAVNGAGATISDLKIVGNVVRTSRTGATTSGIRIRDGTFVDCAVSRNTVVGASHDYVLAEGCTISP